MLVFFSPQNYMYTSEAKLAVKYRALKSLLHFALLLHFAWWQSCLQNWQKQHSHYVEHYGNFKVICDLKRATYKPKGKSKNTGTTVCLVTCKSGLFLEKDPGSNWEFHDVKFEKKNGKNLTLKTINVHAIIVNNYSLLKNMKVQIYPFVNVSLEILFFKLGIYFTKFGNKGTILNWEGSDIRTRGNARKRACKYRR